MLLDSKTYFLLLYIKKKSLYGEQIVGTGYGENRQTVTGGIECGIRKEIAG